MSKTLNQLRDAAAERDEGVIPVTLEELNQVRAENKQRQSQLDWYEKNFDKWLNGGETESIIKQRFIDKERIKNLEEENKRLRDLFQCLNTHFEYSKYPPKFSYVKEIIDKALEKTEEHGNTYIHKFSKMEKI